MHIANQARQEFLEALWGYYSRHGRDNLPWRQPESDGTFDAYKIMVSELMLQQTQVPRVLPMYAEFLQAFPSVESLATAELGDVLRVWQGLGYNRRAKFLWQAAQAVDRLGSFPATKEALVKLPGIGPNTAGAILAYAYNSPGLFIETNVRTVYIYHFFHDQQDVSDKAILELLEQTVDTEQPREFYWAVMDYGSHLKATLGNLNTASKHYTKQSKFHGSRRQVRGAIIRALSNGPATIQELQEQINDERVDTVLVELLDEGLIQQSGDEYRL